MACGGMGDVLSGLCAALIAQGLSLHDAASAGSWLLGRAAESALSYRSEEALSATDVAEHLGQAFIDLKHGAY
jgi:NAD(P)H-hydrate epimerase